MRSRLTALLLPAVLLVAGVVQPVAARTDDGSDVIPCPAGAVSTNVQCLATISEMSQAIAINFIGDTMFVSTTKGLFSYDVSDPSAPNLLGALPMYIWENEDMD